MKKALYLLALLCTTTAVNSQLYVQGGAMFHVGGTVTLQDEDFILGTGGSITFTPDSKVLFSGNKDNIIRGFFGFSNLEIAKSGNHQVSLQNEDLQVSGQMILTAGFFNLNNKTLILGSTGTLINENENSHIIGPTGGSVKVSMPLNQPNNLNPGNIGAAITSTKDLGNVTIDRGYVYATGLPSGAVKRYYTINFADPSKDVDLNATLQLHYLESELNGANETKLALWKFDNGTNAWKEQGPIENITRDEVANWVQLTGINSLSPWTIAETSSPLPVKLTSFNVTCNQNTPILEWQTASETNVHSFEIQRSLNSREWVTIASLPPTNQNNVLANYQYTDQEAAQLDRVYYRIASLDFDGTKSFSPVRTSACGINQDWKVWPNPVRELLNVSITTTQTDKATIQLIDSKGSRVRLWTKYTQSGVNQLTLDVHDLPSGAYHLIITWSHGNDRITAHFIKR